MGRSIAGSEVQTRPSKKILKTSIRWIRWHNLQLHLPLQCAKTQVCIDCKTVVFFSKSVEKSVKRGVCVLHARSSRASHASHVLEYAKIRTVLQSKVCTLILAVCNSLSSNNGQNNVAKNLVTPAHSLSCTCDPSIHLLGRKGRYLKTKGECKECSVSMSGCFVFTSSSYPLGKKSCVIFF